LKEIKDPSMWVTLNLLIMLLIDSKHSLTLYESLKDYAGLGKIRFSVSDFRKLMGLKDGQYKSFSMLTKRVIENAVDEINEKTDLGVLFDVEKVGNKPHSIQFKMKLNKKGVLLSPDSKEIRKKLEAFHFSESEIKDLLKDHHSQYLLANIIVVEERLKKGESIDNPKSYLRAAFRKDFRKKKTEHTAIKEKKEQAKVLQKNAQEKADLELAILK
jgi:plasmid replication initiation protein